jgi:HEAT repeat protein
MTVLVLGGWLIFELQGSKKRYGGQSASYWVSTVNAEFSTPFLKALGTNAVPVLLRAVEKRDNSAKRFYRRIWPSFPQPLKKHLLYPRDPSVIRSNAMMVLNFIDEMHSANIQDADLKTVGPVDSKVLANLMENNFDPLVRYLAACRFCLKKEPTLTPVFIRCLNDSDTKVRHAVLLALANNCKDESVTGPVFAKCLQDSDTDVRSSAALILMDFTNGLDLAVSEIKKAVTNLNPQIRRAASEALKTASGEEEIVRTFVTESNKR